MLPINSGRAWLAVFLFAAVSSAADPEPNPVESAAITVHLDRPLGPIDPRIFGHFTEETLTSYEGGILSEMLFNRKFEMPEERRKTNQPSPIVVGTSNGWEPIEVDSSITLMLDRKVYYSPTQSQRIIRSAGNVPAGIQQKGYRYGMPEMGMIAHQRLDDPFHFRVGERYRVRLAIKSQDLQGSVHVALGESYRKPVAKHLFAFSGATDWKVYQCELQPEAEARGGKFMVYIDSPGAIWVDSVSMVRADLDEDGFRKDVLEATKRVKPTCIRWPGGCFVSDYHWQDGVGPVDQRTAGWNRPWLAYYTNDVGVDEFLSLCGKLNAAPYICVNVGTGTPEEAAALVEYANGDADSKWGRIRAQNGHPTPYGVKAWNIGNEEYLPNIGSTRGELYAKKFDAFARAMRAVDPSIELVAVGAFDLPKSALPRQHPLYSPMRYLFDWNREVLPVAGREATYYSVHHYAPESSVKGLTTEQVNRTALVKAEDLSAKLDRLQQQMSQYVPGGKRLPIALDEWAMWLGPEIPADAAPKPPPGLIHPAYLGFHGSIQTLRDALAESTVYNLMQCRPKDFAIANRTILYAYMVGLFGIARDQVVASPPALMLELYSTFEQCQSIRADVKGPTFDVPPRDGFTGAKSANYLDVSCRIRADGQSADLFVVNRNLDNDIEAAVSFRGKPIGDVVSVATLNAASLTEWNSFKNPDRAKIVTSTKRLSGDKLRHRFPMHSITKLTVGLAR